MASVTVDVELDEFSDDEIFEAASERIAIAFKRNRKEKLLRDIRPLLDEVIESESTFDVKSLDDKLKVEHLMKVWNKYSSFQLEELLPE